MKRKEPEYPCWVAYCSVNPQGTYVCYREKHVSPSDWKFHSKEAAIKHVLKTLNEQKKELAETIKKFRAMKDEE